MKVHHNSFFGPMAAIAIRGVPQKEARIEFNWFWHAPGDLRNVRGGGSRTLVGVKAHGRDNPRVAESRRGR
jgi:hypothetical protein